MTKDTGHAKCEDRARAPDAPSDVGPPPEEATDEAACGRDAAIVALAQSWPFGPVFFLGQLGAFVRERCPEPGEGLPVVEIHVTDGEVLDLCHVMGVAPAWVALAVNDLEAREDEPRMRTELVPYGRIVQVTVRSSRAGKPEMGFNDRSAHRLFQNGATGPVSPEAALLAAAGLRRPPVRSESS
jgi:hypothetical protein